MLKEQKEKKKFTQQRFILLYVLDFGMHIHTRKVHEDSLFFLTSKTCTIDIYIEQNSSAE